MHITLVPYAGLCNRLYAIVAGQAYKQKYPETDLRIMWYKYWHCNCRFGDLFKPLAPGFVPVKELTFQFKDIPGSKYNLNIPQLFRHFWYDCSMLPGMNADLFNELTKGKDRCYIYHDNQFCKAKDVKFGKPYAELFQPTDELQARIDAVTSSWKEEYVVGLHIRRTDNAGSITGSPNEFFYHAIESEIKEHPKAKFYVASDDEMVKQDLQDKYGERIITIPLCLKRSSVKGMKDAVVDLFCLGSTHKIYGSKSSTYSMFAAKLFGIEMIN